MENGVAVALLLPSRYGVRAGRSAAGVPAAPPLVGWGTVLRFAVSSPVLLMGGVGQPATRNRATYTPTLSPIGYGATINTGTSTPGILASRYGKKRLDASSSALPAAIAYGLRRTQGVLVPVLLMREVGRLARNQVVAQHRSVLAIMAATAQVAARHCARLEYLQPLSARHRSLTALSPSNRIVARHALRTSIALSARHACRVVRQPIPIVARHGSLTVLSPTNRVAARHCALLFYAGPSTILQLPSRLLHIDPHSGREREIAFVSAEVSMDDGSHSWSATIALAGMHDWALIQIGDVIRIRLADEEYQLVVDSKNHSQQQPERASPTLNALSPLALRGLPWVMPITQDWSSGAGAAQVVAELIGSVDWQLPDWTIPFGQLAAVHSDPLTLAKQIVAAAGGVIESRPDGSVLCRPAFPVSVPQMATTTPDHCLDGDTILSRDESLEVADCDNRLIVGNATVATEGSQLVVEQADHPTDPFVKQFRVYPTPWRKVSMAHAGDSQVSLYYVGVEERQEVELLEVSQGKAAARYPILSILHYAWQYQDLGIPTVEPGSKIIDIPGSVDRSLLRVIYTTRCQLWEASDPRDEEILFLAYD
ncbi:MAG: hypothetical protein HQM04_06520 [Magnetococcales bacterium]|nr:hypothetical protein [Magnetococcales bacterium]MBF0114681.1 hypothetical protein [Magnetococcales bacterium]